MDESKLIHVQALGSAPAVRISRGDRVPDHFWFGLPLALDLDGGVARNESRLDAPIERFLNGREKLRNLCKTYAVGVQFDDRVADLLKRLRDEGRAVRERVKAGVSEPPALSISFADRGRFTRDLRTFQERDLGKLLDLEHGFNFSVPGAGKTAVAYATYEAERARGRVDRLLVVAPLSAYESWEVEALRCFDDPPRIERFDDRIAYGVEVVLVNYQKLNGYYEELARWAAAGHTHLILDEAHRMKRGRDGQWGSACLDLAQLASRREILTGTPAPQSPRDFVALVDFAWPGQAHKILPRAALVKDPPPEAVDRVSDVLRPLFARTTKSELGLDEPRLRVEPVEMKALQAEIYSALRNRYAGIFDLGVRDQGTLARMGEVSMYLLEAASNPRLLRSREGGATPLRYPNLSIPPGSGLWDLVERYPDHEIPRKFEKVAALVQGNFEQGKKTLVWSNFIDTILDLEQILAPFAPALIYGAIPTTDEVAAESAERTRESQLKKFREDPGCGVLLANPAAMSEGVSLHEHCHDAIYVERTFNAGQYLQSLDRIHRLGLKPGIETNITFLESVGTVDEKVENRLAVKATRLGAMLDDSDLVTMALPDEEDYGAMIEDPEDVEALFEHLSDGSD